MREMCSVGEKSSSIGEKSARFGEKCAAYSEKFASVGEKSQRRTEIWLERTGPYPGLTKGVVNWRGGGDERHRRSVDLEGSGGMLLQIFFINLIGYGVSFCILKDKSLSLYL